MKSLIFSLFLLFVLKSFAGVPLAAVSYDSCSMPKLYTSNGIQIGPDYHPCVLTVTISQGLMFDVHLEVSHCSIYSYTVTYQAPNDSTYTFAYGGHVVAHLFQFPGKYTVAFNYSGWFSEPFVFYLVQNTVGVPELTAGNNGVSVYPNPATDILNVFANENLDEITLMDLDSKPVIYYHAQTQKFEMPVGDLPKGVYLIRVATLNKRVVVKRVILH